MRLWLSVCFVVFLIPIVYASCGNGEIEPGEVCDFGSGRNDMQDLSLSDETFTDFSSPVYGGSDITAYQCGACLEAVEIRVPAPFCGDGVVQPLYGEECEPNPTCSDTGLACTGDGDCPAGTCDSDDSCVACKQSLCTVTDYRCFIDGVWQECHNAGFGDTIDQIEVDVAVDALVDDAQITTFLYNLEDRKFINLGDLKRVVQDAPISGLYQVVADAFISDSGTYILQSVCDFSCSEAVPANPDTWVVPFGEYFSYFTQDLRFSGVSPVEYKANSACCSVADETSFIVAKQRNLQKDLDDPEAIRIKGEAVVPTCFQDGIRLGEGEGATFYQSESVPFGDSCVSEVRTCSDGELSGSYAHSSCVVEEEVLAWPGDANAFITVWKTDNSGFSENDQIELPLIASGTYDFIVDWGDGTLDRITSYDQEQVRHTYDAQGTYTVKMSGTVEGWQTNFVDVAVFPRDAEKLLEVQQWGTLKITGPKAFNRAANLVITATDVLDTSGALDLGGMFYKANSLTSVPNMNLWDVSNVREMELTFYEAENFNEDISSWDVGNVESMRAMFRGAKSFDADLSSWDVGSTEYMQQMFFDADLFNSDIGGWDVASLFSAGQMFMRADSFNQDLSSWDLDGVSVFQMDTDATSWAEENKPLEIR